ncbi:MAG: antibiotic biosynthesis monooxygenase [Burkholderiales bacterium]
MTSSGPSFVVLYRWRLRAGAESAFVEAWSRVTQRLRSERGSLGSRLHRGTDGLWYGYAQWPDAQARDRAFAAGPVDADAMQRMRESIEESLPEIVLESVADFLVLPSAPLDPAGVQLTQERPRG